MRYTINYYDRPAEIVNTDNRFKERKRIIGDSFKNTIDQRTKSYKPAKVARSFKLPRFKSVVYAGLILALAFWIAPRVRYGAPVEAQTEQAQEAKSAELPPSTEPVTATPTPTGDLFDKHFGSEAETMRAICKAESGLDEKAISPVNRNGSRDWGICQINDKAQRDKFTDTAELLNADNNIRIAKMIRDSWGNFNAWTTYKTGKYKKFMK